MKRKITVQEAAMETNEHRRKKPLRRHGENVNIRALHTEMMVSDRMLERFLRKRGKER